MCNFVSDYGITSVYFLVYKKKKITVKSPKTFFDRCAVRQQSHRSCHEDIQNRLSGFEVRLSECAAAQVTSYDKCVAQQQRAMVCQIINSLLNSKCCNFFSIVDQLFDSWQVCYLYWCYSNTFDVFAQF